MHARKNVKGLVPDEFTFQGTRWNLLETGPPVSLIIHSGTGHLVSKETNFNIIINCIL